MIFIAVLEARTIVNERDSLRERLRVENMIIILFFNLKIFVKVATNTGPKERAKYEQHIEDLAANLRKVIYFN